MAPRATTAKKSAQVAEATETETEIEYDGTTYVVPSALDLPMEILEADGELAVLQLILGEKQWKAFRSGKPTLRNFRDFAELVVEAAGFDDLGN